MAAAAAEVAISGRMNPAAISAPAVPPTPRRAARSRPAPATATWTTIFRSERDEARASDSLGEGFRPGRLLTSIPRFNVNSRDILGWHLKIQTKTRLSLSAFQL